MKTTTLFFRSSFLALILLGTPVAFASDLPGNNAHQSDVISQGTILFSNHAMSTTPSGKYLYQSRELDIILHANSFSYEIKNPNVTSAKQKVNISFPGSKPNPEVSSTYQNSVGVKNTFESEFSFIDYNNEMILSKVLYKDLYPHIDLEFFIRPQDGLPEYNFVLHKGAVICDLRMKYQGTRQLTLKNGKTLQLGLKNGMLEENIPLSFVNDASQPVSVNYTIIGPNLIGFSINSSTPLPEGKLVIDPVPTLRWVRHPAPDPHFQDATKAVWDFDGNLVVTGNVNALPMRRVGNIAADMTKVAGITKYIYITKYNVNGDKMWTNYFRDDAQLSVTDMKIDSRNNIILVGMAIGTEMRVATPGAHQTEPGGGLMDGFIAKFDQNGGLKWATLYGGENEDAINGVAINDNDDIVVVGVTNSVNSIASHGSYQSVFPGHRSGFVAAFSRNGQRNWATYYGGTHGNSDNLEKVAIDANRNIIAVGSTYCRLGISSTGAFQEKNKGMLEGMMIKFDVVGNRIWATYLGTAYDDQIIDVAVNATKQIIVTGNSNYRKTTSNVASDNSTTIANSFRTTNVAGLDGDDRDDFSATPFNVFIAKYAENGEQSWYKTYGGSANDWVSAISLDTYSNIFITGTSFSRNGIASKGAYQETAGGDQDAYVAMFTTNGDRVYGTYFGNTGYDQGNGISVNERGAVSIAGISANASGVPSRDVTRYNAHVPNALATGQRIGVGFVVTFRNSVSGPARPPADNEAPVSDFISVIASPSVSFDGRHTLRPELARATTLTIVIHDATGRLVQSFNTSASEGVNTLEISLADQKPGIYFVNLQTETSLNTVKLLKQ